jgi:hypothetical protein
MQTEEFYIIYPEGDVQEVPGRLPFNQIVDVNGNLLRLPLPTNRMIAFKVARISVKETRGEKITSHYLELMSADELREYSRH